MILVDVHAHLDSVFFGQEISGIVQRAEQAGIKAIIANGVDKRTNREVIELSNKYPIIKPALGIYPPDALERETNKAREWNIDEEVNYIECNIDKIIAIGEVGLDYKNGKEKELQQSTFRKLIKVAISCKKPLIVHSRNAEKDVIEILEEYKYPKIVMHCFGGNHKLVQRIRDNKWYFSIPTNIVRSEHMQKIVNDTPLSQILTETDAPFLSPFKDKRNEPAFIIETIKKIADIKKLEPEEVANIVWMNYQRVFE